MKRIAELRTELKLSQTELAKKIGVSQQTISKYEQGIREPDIATLIRLAKIFNVSVDYLLETPFIDNSSSYILNDEEQELISYYKQLNKTDRRWIMGQIIDLIKKADEQDFTNLKAQ